MTALRVFVASPLRLRARIPAIVRPAIEERAMAELPSTDAWSSPDCSANGSELSILIGSRDD